MKFPRILLATAIAGVGMIGLAAPSHAQLTTYCDGVASDVTVPGDLVVRAGDACELTGVTVQGDVAVRAGADLILADSAVEGNLAVQADAFADVLDTSVAGTTRLNTAYGVYSEGSDHAGAVTAREPDFFYGVGSVFAANVTSTDGETYLESTRLDRNLSTSGDVLTDVYDTVVQGRLEIGGTADGSVVCASEIDGPAAFDGNAGQVQVGPGRIADCDFNAFGGDLSLTGNTDVSTVTGNLVRGDLICTENTPATVAADNRVRGEDQCQGAAAPASRGAAAEAEIRRADVLADIDARRAEGRAAAADAGLAFD